MTTNQYAESYHCQLWLTMACCDLRWNIYCSKQDDQYQLAHTVDLHTAARLPDVQQNAYASVDGYS